MGAAKIVGLLVLIFVINDWKLMPYSVSGAAPNCTNSSHGGVHCRPLPYGPITLEQANNETAVGLKALDTNCNQLPPTLSPNATINSTATLSIRAVDPNKLLLPGPAVNGTQLDVYKSCQCPALATTNHVNDTTALATLPTSKQVENSSAVATTEQNNSVAQGCKCLALDTNKQADNTTAIVTLPTTKQISNATALVTIPTTKQISNATALVALPTTKQISNATALVTVPTTKQISNATALVTVPTTKQISNATALVTVPTTKQISNATALVTVPTTKQISNATALVTIPPTNQVNKSTALATTKQGKCATKGVKVPAMPTSKQDVNTSTALATTKQDNGKAVPSPKEPVCKNTGAPTEFTKDNEKNTCRATNASVSAAGDTRTCRATNATGETRTCRASCNPPTSKPKCRKPAAVDPSVPRPAERRDEECYISDVEETMVMATCASCSARANVNGVGVTLTCFDCHHIPADKTCHYSKYDPKIKVSAKFFELAEYSGRGNVSEPAPASTPTPKDDKKQQKKK